MTVLLIIMLVLALESVVGNKHQRIIILVHDIEIVIVNVNKSQKRIIVDLFTRTIRY